VREPDDRKIAGVCSGLADYMGVDVTVVRVGAVALALITPVALIGYLVASVTLPERQPDEPRVRARRVHLGRIPHPVIVVGAIVAVAAIVDDAWWLDPFPAAVALVGVGVWLIVQGRDDMDGPLASPVPTAPHTDGPDPVDAPGPEDAPSVDDAPVILHPMAASPWNVAVSQHFNAERDQDTTLTVSPPTPDSTESLDALEGTGSSGELPPPASPWWSARPEPPVPVPAPARPRSHPSRVGSVVVALLLVGAGGLWLVDSLDIAHVSGADALALGLLVVGTGLVVAAWRGRAYALIPIAGVLAGVLMVGEALDVPLDAGTGERTEIVDTARGLEQHHELFAGELTVDLTDAPLPTARPSRVEASVGVGELRVVVPEGATVEVDATARIGEVVSPGGADANESGVGLDESFTLDGDAGGPRLELDLSVGLGSVEVSRG
jgi:phage shock protein PspC (stress-responsive transcriptional regulator)